MSLLNFSSDQTRALGTGRFDCSNCKVLTEFIVYRVSEVGYTVVGPIPVKSQDDLIGDFVQCQKCKRADCVSTLADCETEVGTFNAQEYCRNILTLTDRAAEEIKSRLQTGDFGLDSYVRIAPHWFGSGCEVTFDIPCIDDRDWLGRSGDLAIVLDKRHEKQLSGTLDFDGRQYQFSY